MDQKTGKTILCEFCNVLTKNHINGFYRCVTCGNIYNGQYQTTEYEDSYFEVEYKKQYGKSYIEDKPDIQKKMQSRLDCIKPYISSFTDKKLLEAGSAAGFFLEIAREAGFYVKGWEISSYMTKFANQQGNTTIQGNFLNLLEKEHDESYDVIAAFYVIEHFREQNKIWQGFYRLLKKDGLLLLAMPSFFGPAFYFHKKDWVKNHPLDHYIDYSPAGIKKVCNLFGLKLLHIYPEGLHPERFLLGNTFFLKYFYTMIQKTCKFTDTMFVVIQK
jgi:SAM-dependent methyltransferase